MAMKKPGKILVTYISVGAGHRMAAEAVRRGLARVCPESQVILFDLLDFWRRPAVLLGTALYRSVIRLQPELYGSPTARSRLSWALRRFCRLNRRAVSNLIAETEPAVAVCTQALPSLLLSDFRRLSGHPLRQVAVPTDFAVHDYWLEPEIDCFCLPEPGIRANLLGRGIPREKLKVTGIPVDPAFARELPVGELRRRHGFSSGQSVVLVMGGGEGTGHLVRLVRELLEEGGGYQLAVVAGKNLRTLARLREIQALAGERLKVFGFIESVDELMAISDIIVTKPGGLTASEALIKKVPMVLVDPIPGQETINADFLVKEGAAILCSHLPRIGKFVGDLLADPERLEEMRRAARKLARPDSALDVAREIATLQ